MRDHVLIVDDNRDLADSLAEAVTRFGYRAKAVYSGEDAVLETASFLPDIVLMDLNMPQLDGCETVARIRQKRPAAEIILVAITGLCGAEHRQRAYDAGFDRLRRCAPVIVLGCDHGHLQNELAVFSVAGSSIERPVAS